MSVGAEMVVVLKAFVEYCVSLVLGHPFEFSWLEVSQTDVSHRFLLLFSVQPLCSLCLVSKNNHGDTENTEVAQRRIPWRECLLTSGCDRACTLVTHDNDAIRADYA